MCYNRILLSATFCLLMLFASCKKKVEDETAPTRWGRENYYEKFLWKKHVPDTLYKTMEFDFSQDAKNFMDKPLRLGLYKKTDSGKMMPVTGSEMTVYMDDKRCEDNIIDVEPGTDQLKVGIVFNPDAENKVHHWFFRAVDDGGLERINDMAPDVFNSDNASLMDIEVEKHKVMNPLKECVLIIGMVLLAALLVWLFVLKRMFFPIFRVGKVVLTDPIPYNSLKKLRGYRKMVMTNKIVKQSALSMLFTGKIQYEVNQIWTSDVTIEPRDRKSVRLRYPSNSYIANAHVLKTNEEYTIQNITTGNKTIIKVY